MFVLQGLSGLDLFGGNKKKRFANLQIKVGGYDGSSGPLGNLNRAVNCFWSMP